MKKHLWLKILFIVALSSCTIVKTQDIPTTTPSSTNTPQLQEVKLSPSPTITALPTIHYQITYPADCGDEFQCMYVIEVSCLDSLSPCLGKPEILFKVSKTGEGPRGPMLFHSWSPDGQQIALAATGFNEASDIFLGERDGQNWVNLTNSSTPDGFPIWSPSGDVIYFVGKIEPENYLRIYSITPDRKSKTQLLSMLDSSVYDAFNFSFSPDGKRITFVHSSNEGFYQLYVADPNGSNLKQITNEPGDHLNPQYSPDGKWILYTQDPPTREMSSNLKLIRPDGSTERSITQDANTMRMGVSWSPVGNWITFLATPKESHDYAVYLIRPDGTGLTRITPSDQDASFPAWRVILR